MKSFTALSKAKVGMLALSAFIISNASAHQHDQNNSGLNANGEQVLCNFAPENTLQIPEGLEVAGQGIDEKTFNSVMDKIEAVYAPIVKKNGGTLKVNRLWSNATVNASATRKGKQWVLNMYGGLARHEITTADGFALVVCHELGHHLGGFPRGKAIFGASWASNEGQSDYFATMKCFRKVYENDDNVSFVRNSEVPASVTANCQKTWKSAKEIALCQREALGGKVLADLLYSLGRSGASPREPATAPAYDTPTNAVVSATDDKHPLAQCRLDTYMAGALCGMAHTEDFSKDNAIGGACAEERGDKFAVRPNCWYKPGNKSL